MPNKEFPLTTLQQYLPDESLERVIYYLKTYNICLTITRKRNSILGDYRHPILNQPHRISINGSLNKYSFLITFLHELAHLFAFEKYGNKIQAHGKEWKKEFGIILSEFIEKNIFPFDITHALKNNLHNPAASSCVDENLLKVLFNYDNKPDDSFLLEQLSENSFFKISKERVFQKNEKIRKRYKCTEIKTGKTYLFSPVYEVTVLQPSTLSS